MKQTGLLYWTNSWRSFKCHLWKRNRIDNINLRSEKRHDSCCSTILTMLNPIEHVAHAWMHILCWCTCAFTEGTSVQQGNFWSELWIAIDGSHGSALSSSTALYSDRVAPYLFLATEFQSFYILRHLPCLSLHQPLSLSSLCQTSFSSISIHVNRPYPKAPRIPKIPRG